MIQIKTDKEIQTMQEGAEILSAILSKVSKAVKPGITTKQLDELAASLVAKAGAKPSFLGYNGYPAVLCTSVNNVVVHGIPSDYALKPGDIVGLDLGILYKGFHTDMAATVPVGEISFENQRLLRATKKALKLAITKAKVGNTFGDIGNTIQRYIEDQGFSVVRDLCGHGVGKDLHEDPQILNYGKRHTGEAIKPGMVFCLEPMINTGGWEIELMADKWGYSTKDKLPSAHFEHVIAITSDGKTKVLTKFD